MLLVTGGRVANTGMRWEDENRRSLGTAWGGAPARHEPVTGTLNLRELGQAQAVRLQALDPCGQATGSARAFAFVDGAWVIELATDGASVWYLIEVTR
jgi:hypothetical protein